MHGIRNLPEASQDYLDKTEFSGQPLLPWSNILVRKLVEIFLDHLSCYYSSRHCRTWKYTEYILEGNSNKESHRKKLKYTYRTCGHNCSGIIMMPCKPANIKVFISFFVHYILFEALPHNQVLLNFLTITCKCFHCCWWNSKFTF